LSAVSISSSEIDKTLNSLIRVFEDLKINSVRDITESEIYQIIQRVLISQLFGASRFVVSQIQIIVQTQSPDTIIATQESAFVSEYNRSQFEFNKYLFCYNKYRQ